MTVMNLDQLDVWTLSRDFAVTIYKKVVPLLPPTEKYNMADQLKRAAVSIPANIAEGHGRYCYQDNVRFCYIARGSLTEIQSHLSLEKNWGSSRHRFTPTSQARLKQLSGVSTVGSLISKNRKSAQTNPVPPALSMKTNQNTTQTSPPPIKH
ncbi:MAG: four helix bundle protein [Anaerolineales bacterium]|nr:four helix bundle protein [Anaerolineales bacterium]